MAISTGTLRESALDHRTAWPSAGSWRCSPHWSCCSAWPACCTSAAAL